MTGAIRPFRRSDRDQVTALINAHAQAVVPGAAVSVNAVLSHLEREPGEFLVDPWVRERATLVVEQRGRVTAVAHLVRYGAEPDVGPALRDSADIRWLLHWPDQPIWPDSSVAGLAVAEAADIGNLHVEPAHRRRGVGTALLVEVGDWLRLARVPRLLAYATPDETEHRAVLERHDFRMLTRTHREWRLST